MSQLDNSHADIIILNAKVYTVDAQNPTAEAVAVRHGKIVFVGNDSEAEQWRGPATLVLDGSGRSLLPGFIDSHFHLLWGSKLLGGPQLHGADSLEMVKLSIEAWLKLNERSDWIVGQGISYSIPDAKTPLNRHHLDKIVADRPLVLMAFDQHSMFANSLALERAGITQGVAEKLANGNIPVDEAGLATGELYEMDAMDYINKALPEPSDYQLRQMTRDGLAYAASLGITSVHNMDGDYEQTAWYAKLEDLGDLSLRIYMPFWAKPGDDVANVIDQATAMKRDFASDKVRAGAVKFFMDGVYESHTAVTLNGFGDKADHNGEPIWSAAEFATMVTAADKAGFQIAVHAVGDGAVKAVLDGYEAARKQNGSRDSRHRIEHIEVVDPNDIGRFKKLDVIASMQPLHAPNRANKLDVWPLRVKPEDWHASFVWRAFRKAGVRLAFGSDWPVAPADPIFGLFVAVNRQPFRDGLAEQQQTLAEAIAGYTVDAAYTEFQEAVKGQIKVGYYADLVLLSEDIFAIPDEEIRNVMVETTICAGQVVFSREPAGDPPMTPFTVVNIQPEHAPALRQLQLACFPSVPPAELFSEADFIEMYETFPEGAFVAFGEGEVVGLGAGMFIDFDFDHPNHTMDDILRGGHKADGAYYYGTDISVHPQFRRRGLGRILYERRKEVVRHYNRRGIVAGGFIPGYADYKNEMDVESYVAKVVSGELYDATLTMQLNNGFVVRGILNNYMAVDASDGHVSLIFWPNPDYVEESR